MSDLEEAIRIGQEAADATPTDHPDRASRLSNFGIRLRDRYSRTGAIGDVEEAIRITEEAVNASPKDHPDRASRLNRLGISLRDRYLRKGAMSDLEDAIRIGREAVDATPKDYPDRASRLNNLGISLRDRYSKTGAIGDLEEAVRIGQEAVDATPKDHPDRAPLLNNLGIGLSARYSRKGAISDLEEAIRVGQEAVDSTPKDHPDRIPRLNNLGIGFSDRYSRTGAMSDLEDAIQITQEAVDATPKDHPDRAKWLSNLGNRLSDRYSRTGAISDLEEAIRVIREAVDATPEDHPDRAERLNSLGGRLGDRYTRTEAMSDLEEAISCHQTALRQSSSSVLTRIKAGQGILHHCVTIQDWQQGYDASSTAVHLTSKLTARSLETSDKQHTLAQVVGLASDAAAAALHASKGPLEALALLEEGRGILATSLEDMRLDVKDLEDRYPGLATQFVSLRDQLDRPIGCKTSIMEESIKPSWHAQANPRYEAGKGLDILIPKIREHSGFEDFLLGPSEGDMRAAAKFGPIVVINVSQYRCDAILVEEGQIRLLPLPSLNREDIEGKAKESDLSRPRVLEWLWDVVAGPVLDALGLTQAFYGDDLPHVWWIPTGPLTKFPLHAAGYHKWTDSETVLDRVMSSYSSSIKALIHGRRRRKPEALSASTRALLVAMRDTPGIANSLPFVTTEVMAVRNICESMGINAVEPERRKQAVTSQLAQCTLFHFAGHGYSNTSDPSQSKLLLDDWEREPLTVATLLEMSLRENSPFLAYLSACGTGQIRDDRFTDESIHLISACQLAGFRHVIGTMWEVNDELCVEMARMTYEKMRDEGMTDESVCLGLHCASRELRDRWMNRTCKGKASRDIITAGDDQEGMGPAQWIPYVHVGV